MVVNFRKSCTLTPALTLPWAYDGSQSVIGVAGVHRVMAEVATATDKAGKAIADGQAQLQKEAEKVRTCTGRHTHSA